MPNPPDFLLSIYLRGGADGLSFLPPYDEQPYQTQRSATKFHPPGTTGGPADALPLTALDPTTTPYTPAFGLAPALAPLLTVYGWQKLAFVHACGSVVDTRSHFDQQYHTEVGSIQGTAVTNPAGIWARHLQAAPPVGTGALRALAIQLKIPDILREAPAAAPVGDPSSYGFPGDSLTAGERRDALEDVYTLEGQPILGALQNMLATIDELQSVPFGSYVPSNGAVYPGTPLGKACKQAAQMCKVLPGMEIVHVDSGGWDTHYNEGPVSGYLAGRIQDLAESLAAFATDLAAAPRKAVVLVMTEFGRTLKENEGLGTDHGRGGVAVVAGHEVIGGKVYTRWPGMGPGELDPSGDLDVGVDVRDVIAELAQKRLGAVGYSHLFADPTFVANPLGIFN